MVILVSVEESLLKWGVFPEIADIEVLQKERTRTSGLCSLIELIVLWDHRVQTLILAMMQGDSFIYGSPYLLKSLESLVSIVKARRMNFYNQFEWNERQTTSSACNLVNKQRKQQEAPMEKQNGKQSLNEIHFIYKRKGLMRMQV